MLAMELFQILFMFQVLNVTFSQFISNSSKSPASENQTHSVKVLAAVFPPFTYFDSSRGFIDGIDIRALQIIAKKLNLKLTFTKADDFSNISDEKLE